MPTLSIGLLLVALSAAGFAFTMFGRRPPVQTATTDRGTGSTAVTSSRVERQRSRRLRPAGAQVIDVGMTPRLHVEVPSAVRVRSAFLLGLGVITAAAMIGVVLSVVIVGSFTLIH